MDISIARNAYGRQIDSFIAPLAPTPHWKDNVEIEGIFIRAPKVVEIGEGVRSFFMHGKEVVMAEQGHCLMTTFHPELSDTASIHRHFLTKCGWEIST